jgi:hypothetical protein
MNVVQRALLGVGVVSVAIGLAAYVSPTVAGVAFVDEFYVVMVGGLATLQAGRVARDAWRAPTDLATTGDPELVEGIPTPGEEFDETLAAAGSVHQIDGRQEVERRLGRAAREVLERRRGCSPEEARERLEDGSWADDSLAAAFFSERAQKRIPWRTRTRIRLGSDSEYGVRAERAAAELDRIWREDT